MFDTHAKNTVAIHVTLLDLAIIEASEEVVSPMNIQVAIGRRHGNGLFGS